ncbi:MAG TPA: transketolase [Phycisphaerae bacterium]|nr:transketolase [Phycisphaerae bacterium]
MATFDKILTAKAIHIGKLAAQATTAAGSGHPSTALSLATITAVLMYHVMRWDPADPANAGSDRLVLSEGHAVPIIYAACADLGVTIYPGAVGHTTAEKADGPGKRMTVDDLLTLRDIKSPIDGHPNPMMGFPFFDAATGSLGQGLSVAGGLGAAARVDKHNKVIYCIIGDGESREGQIWEAMDFIADQKLSNVVAIFNCNEIAQSDYVAAAQTADALQKKAEAFGWKAINVDGHDPTALVNALKQRTEAMVAGKPLCLIARTVKGWGAASQQGLGHHGHPIPEKDLASVLKELDATAEELGAAGISADESKKVLKIHPPLPAPAKPQAGKLITLAQAAEKAKLTDALVTKKKLSPRRAFGLALDALGDANPNVVGLDADVKNSTFAQDFAKDHPSHYFECRIAEQNMVSVAAGLASGHKIPFASTFGKFFSRAFDQIEMAIIGGSNIKLVGTHIGVTLAADGPSQMAITDVAILRAIGHATDHRGKPAITVLTPCDAVSAYAMVLAMAEWPSAVYLRALRADTGIVYGESETFEFGKFKVVKKGTGGGKGKKLTIATSGYLVHTVLKAAPKFEQAGIDLTLVDAYSLPFAADELLALAEGGPILTVEDNYTGGIGSEVAEAAAKTGKVKVDSLFIRNLPKSGKTPEDVLEFVHLGEADILAKAKSLVG